MDTGTLIVIGISFLLFVATEFFFPINREDAVARSQKHFWSIIITILSLVMGFTIKGSYETQQRLENVGVVFRRLTSPTIQEKFQYLFTLYHEHFDHAQPVLKGWATGALDQLREDMSHGYISLPQEIASREIGKVYPYAKENIVATNVGSTKFYFKDNSYVAANTASRNRGIPIVRFYLYSPTHKIEQTNSEEARTLTIDEFFNNEVKPLHEKLGSVYSVVIEVEKVKGLTEVRDLLILDNTFVAETKLEQPTWLVLKAQATEDEKNLKEAREYFRTLMAAINPKYVVPMSDDDIRRYFHKYEGVKVSGPLAEKVFDDVMHDVMHEMAGIP